MPAAAAALPWISAAISAIGVIGSLTKKNDTPQVVQQNPAADAAAAEAKAVQDAEQKKLQQRRAARANSLLSAAGAAGDPTDPLTIAGTASGKTTLGA